MTDADKAIARRVIGEGLSVKKMKEQIRNVEDAMSETESISGCAP